MDIPLDVAVRLCEEISEANRHKWYTLSGLWCWGCARSASHITRRCFVGAPGNRGCLEINERYAREQALSR